MTYPDIETLLPHDHPMIVIDRVVDADDDSLETEVTVSAAHPFFDHDRAAMPAWSVIEIMAQSIAAHAGLKAVSAGRPVKPGFLLGTRRLTFGTSWCPRGSNLRTRVTSDYAATEGLASYRCRTTLDDREIVAGVINVYQRNADQLNDKEPES